MCESDLKDHTATSVAAQGLFFCVLAELHHTARYVLAVFLSFLKLLDLCICFCMCWSFALVENQIN